MLCAGYDLVTDECNGNVSFTIDRDRANLGLRYLEEEINWRVKEICRPMESGSLLCEAELPMLLPFKVSMRRTKRNFKEFFCSLMEKDVIDGINTLALET